MLFVMSVCSSFKGRGIVQVDETKIGKRKKNRGRWLAGSWIFGMIENRSEDFRVVVCLDEKETGHLKGPSSYSISHLEPSF